MNDINLEQNALLTQWKRLGHGLGRQALIHWKRLSPGLRRHVDPMIVHGIATIVAILFMSLTKKVLYYTMGYDARFFDVLPVRYVIDAIDLLMCMRFLLSVWRR